MGRAPLADLREALRLAVELSWAVSDKALSYYGAKENPLPVNNLRVAQTFKSAVSPTSKSAGWRTGLLVWKPATQQTWKSALRYRISVAAYLALWRAC